MIMEQYVNFCTAEQTKRAYKLCAPIETRRYTCPHSWIVTTLSEEKMILRIPTTQQMIGWLSEKGIFITLDAEYSYDTKNIVFYWCIFKFDPYYNYLLSEKCNNYKESELAAIDAALDYLEKGE